MKPQNAILAPHSETSPKEEHMHTSGTSVMNKVILVNRKRRVTKIIKNYMQKH